MSDRTQTVTGGNRSRRGFTLIELLVAVGVLSLIVLVLFRIFDQTQRAMRGNAAQVDVMEGGRAIMDLLKRDLEQVLSPEGATNTVNFYVALSAPEHALDLPGSAVGSSRTNRLDEIYFLKPSRNSPANGLWDATLYRVLSVSNTTPDRLQNPIYAPALAVEGVGSLTRRTERIETLLVNPTDGDPMNRPLTSRLHPLNEVRSMVETNWGKFSQVANGIVHFKVTPLDSLGIPVEFYDRGNTNAYYPRVLRRVDPLAFGRSYLFLGSSLPASLQVELGIVEPQIADRWRSLPNPQVRAEFLNEQASRIHFFKQRIPLRNAPELFP